MTPNPTIHIVGRGIVGSRLHRLLNKHSVIGHDPYWPEVGSTTPGDLVILAQGGSHAKLVPKLIERRLHIVTVGDELDDALDILQFDSVARTAGTSLVIGAAMSPGLSGLLVRHLADQLEQLDEIHIAVHGAAGPACARVHHKSLSGWSIGCRDGEWIEYVGGSGRELCWFPEPVGAQDCYRAQIATPLLLHRTFPNADRISVRRSARRRDRFTARLPMLRPPHDEGGIGALRVEVRGSSADGRRQCLITGIAELVGTAAAATAAAFAEELLEHGLPAGAVITSDEALSTVRLLHRVQAFGVRLQEFTGVPQPG